jgi:predicted GIY-YIG superfamily endonuclease
MYLYYLSSSLDDKFYIGITNDPEKRLKSHLTYTQRSYYKSNWIRKVIKSGGEIKMNIILSGLDRSTAGKLEVKFIELFKSLGFKLTNIASGGLNFNHKGIPHSDAHNRALEQAQPHKVRLPKDELYDLYVNQKLSKKTISKIYECGITTIDRRLKEYNIPIRVTENYKASYKLDRDKIIEMYNSGLNLREISKSVGVSIKSNVIRNLLIRNKIYKIN